MPEPLAFQEPSEVGHSPKPEPENLTHLGYIREEFGGVHAAKLWFSIAGLVFLLNLVLYRLSFIEDARAYIAQGITATVGLIGIIIQWSSRDRCVWVDANGKNRHSFRPRQYRSSVVLDLTTSQKAKADFRQERFTDPHVGEIQCDYGEERWQALAGGQVVFMIRKIWKDSELAAVEGCLSTVGMRHAVLADPRLHPNTVERLVEKFAVAHHHSQINGYIHEYIGPGNPPQADESR
ncbi:MAG: hypothetical protein HONBIEJF_01408 [Fimbriimonadaceae bacterium]|nr:hypothetical protein [Fimbriimonadaceae bacterium]